MASSTIKQIDGNIGGSHEGYPTKDYLKLPNGVLIQWGTLQNVTATTTVVTFPIPYKVGRLPAVTAVSGAGSGRGTVSVEGVTINQFEIWQSTTVAKWLRWIAIGYWK